MKIPLSILLSAVGGYVDTVGFLALGGLFTAHVTGNFVTIGAALTQGSSGVVAKLLALPVFCAAVIGTRLVSHALARRGHPVLRRLLWAQVALLAAGAALAILLRPFKSWDDPNAILTGMIFVAAMAIQNAAHRVHLANAPPSTLMTGTTTQIMLDLADLLHGSVQREAVRARTRRLAHAVAAFVAGCAAGATLFALSGNWAFKPPALAVFLAAYAAEAGAIESAKTDG